ncbi:MAG: hypothetical protein V7784_11635 [Oceanospirillaceae bacterium]
MQTLKKLSNFLSPQQLISDTSAQWIIECYAYALQNFDEQEFYQRSVLVKPSNEFFPGKVASIEEKAENIFQHCLKYSGLQHWPFQLYHPGEKAETSLHSFGFEVLKRNSAGKLENLAVNESSPSPAIPIPPMMLSYNPQQTLKPEDLAASYAQLLAQHLILQAKQLPPGGRDYFIEASEVVGIFMGFGIVMCNSAYTFRGGCGSCFNAAANRQASLAEGEVLFALALYCHLKKIDAGEVTAHLKKHMKRGYKTAVKQVSNMAANNLLTALHKPST